MPKPNPLRSGHIDDQNPATPERLPGSTATITSVPTGNEEDLGGRPAFLFRSDEMLGVTLDSSGANLPPRKAPWILERYFTLGVRDVGLANINPEAIIHGIRANGYHLWRAHDI